MGPASGWASPRASQCPGQTAQQFPGFKKCSPSMRPGTRNAKDGSPSLWPVWGCRGFWTVGGEGPPKLHLAAHEAAHALECQAAGTGLTSLPLIGAITVPSTPGPSQGPPDHKADGGDGFPCSSSPLADVSEFFPVRPPPRSAGLAEHRACRPRGPRSPASARSQLHAALRPGPPSVWGCWCGNGCTEMPPCSRAMHTPQDQMVSSAHHLRLQTPKLTTSVIWLELCVRVGWGAEGLQPSGPERWHPGRWAPAPPAARQGPGLVPGARRPAHTPVRIPPVPSRSTFYL